MDEQAITAVVATPDVTTPPTVAGGKRGHIKASEIIGREREGSEAVDADALSKALLNFEDAGRAREKIASSSPSRKRQRIYGDRSAEPFFLI